MSAGYAGQLKCYCQLNRVGLRASSDDSTGVLPHLSTYRGLCTEAAGLTSQNAVGGQIIEQLANDCRVLFDGWSAGLGTELFDVGGDADGLDIRQLQPTLVAP